MVRTHAVYPDAIEPDFDALDAYARAGETGDADLVASAYAEDGVLRSPIFGRFAFHGRDDIRTLMRVVYRVAKRSQFTARAVDGRTAMLAANSRVVGLRIEEAFVVELDDDGKLKVVTVHIRPLLGLIVFTLVLAARMSAHPMLLLRAARG